MTTQNGKVNRRILDLDSIIPDRPTVRIDGHDYEMRLPGDFGVRETVKFQRLKSEVMRLGMIEDPTDEDAEAMDKALGEAVKLIMVDIPDEVLSSLRDSKKIAILQVFPSAAMRTPQTTQDAGPSPSTGEMSSLASTDSMGRGEIG